MVRPEALATTEPATGRPFPFAELAERRPTGRQGAAAAVGRHLHPAAQPVAAPLVWRPVRHRAAGQDHPRLIGSYRQKTFTIDSRVGYCGGMNVKENDWDSPAHRVFEPRRNPHATRAAFRKAVQAASSARSSRPPTCPCGSRDRRSTTWR
ncbi:MAG: hypothetical protein R3F43_26980 [bacterium]